MTRYLSFQYPNFPNSKVKQQESALKILESYNIDYNSYISVKQPLDKSYEHDTVTDNVSVNNNGNEIQKLWISTWGKNPAIPEQDETQKLLDRFGYEKVYKAMYESKLKNFYSIKTLANSLDENGNIIPKEKNNVRTGKGAVDVDAVAAEIKKYT